MAKGKHATALFEVIHKNKRMEPKSGGRSMLRLPRWLLRGRTQTAFPPGDAAPAPAAATGGAEGTIGPEAAAGRATIDPVASAPPPAAPKPAAAAAEQASPPDHSASPAASMPPATSFPPAAALPGVEVAVDPHQQKISLSMTYLTALMMGCSVVALVALAYVIGRQVSRGPSPVIASMPSDQIRRLPAQPEVLEVNRPAATRTDTAAQPAPRQAQRATPTWNDPRPPQTLVVMDERRTVGLQYVVIQSYPNEKDANEARDLLIKHGILCTVETGLRWAPRWHSVVGIYGFDKISNSREYDEYIAAIRRIGTEFAPNSRFKQFDPRPMRWERTGD